MHQLIYCCRGLRGARWLAMAAALLMLCSASTVAQARSDVGSARANSAPAADGASHAPFVAGPRKAGSGHLGFRLGYYHNDDAGDGNPFLDETLTVIEPAVFFDYNVTDSTNVWGKLHYDHVSSASIARLSRFENHSGASGDQYLGLDLGGTWSLAAHNRIGAFVHGSTETDYSSFGFGGHFAHDLDGDSTTLKYSLSAYLDNVDVIRFDGTDEPAQRRTAINAAVHWYQIVDARTHADMGFNLTVQNGLLSTPYNGVVLENPADPPNPTLANNARGIEFAERLPNHRLRGTLFGKVRRSLGARTAGEIGARLYADDWGIESATIEPAMHLWLAPDTLMVRLSHRYYTQGAADDHHSSFVGVSLPRFRTQDADLARFSSHTVGCRFDWFASADVRWDLTFDYQFRDDGLDNLFGSLGCTVSF